MHDISGEILVAASRGDLASFETVYKAASSFNPVRLYQEAGAKDQIEYLDSLVSVPGERLFNEGNGFDTAVERYFL